MILKIGELVSGELVAAEPIASEAKTRDEGHHLLLDPVMQVALDATPLRVLGRDETYPGR